MSRELCFLTIAEAGRRFRSGDLSPVALTEAFLARIAEINPRIDAYLLVTADAALAAARTAETELAAGRDRGPLHGIPVAFKDNIETAGIRTTAHSRVLLDHLPAADAAVVEKLKAAGAVPLGKLACLEFAHGAPSPDQAFPPARNPWNPDHGFTGGSSTGSGAAVAAGLAMAALGTDTGGSIRNPAALCGTAGLMPTYGRVSRRGVIPYAFSLDACGPLAWTVEDCALVLGAIAGFDAADPGSADLPVPDFTAGLGRGVAGARIGVLRHFFEDDMVADREMAASIDAALEVLAGLGARVSEARVHPLMDYHDVKTLIGEAEFFAAHEADWLARAGDFGASLQYRTAEGAMIPAVDYLQAQRARRHLATEMDAMFDDFDVLVTATVLDPAPPMARDGGGPRARKPNLTQPFNVAGVPALSVCTGFNAAGLPLAMQIAGRAFDEAAILGVGHAYESATPHRDRRPQL
ncbi:MAG: amidase [Alphaproteobacteria bacterium]|nr:amidase [Alphaproteobacteria bacterium]